MAHASCPACGVSLPSAIHPIDGSISCPKCGKRLRIAARAEPPPEPGPLVDASRYRRISGGTSLPRTLAVVAGVAVLLAGAVVGFIVWGPKDRGSPPPAKDPIAQKPPPKTNPDNPAPDDPINRIKPAPTPNNTGQPKPPEPPPMPAPPEAPPAEPDAWKEIALADAPPDLASQVLGKINALRKTAGAAPLSADAEASAACTAHAGYLARNAGRIAALGLNMHAEEADLPGRSDAGRKAAPPALIAAKEPLTAVTDWAALPACRTLFLRPELKTVGVGFARNVQGQWASVFAWPDAAPVPAGDAVLYPSDGQMHVPLFFPGAEVPDPVPMVPSKGTTSGFPITATFPPHAQVKSAEARLEDESGAPVDAWISSPEKPANPDHAAAQQNTIGIIAKTPLRAGARYIVQVEARVDGRDWRRTWTFLTVGPEDLRHDFEDRILAKINAARQKNGMDPIALDPATSRACTEHAHYLSLNIPAHRDLKRNDETPDWPGYSEEGRKIAAKSLSQIGVGRADQWADFLLAALIARQLFLEPNVKRIGLGSNWIGAEAGSWVLDASPPGEWSENKEPILYPYADQQGVPVRYTGDQPSPLPAEAQGKPAGCPVTIRFSWHKPVDKVTARLTDAAGQEVPAWLSTPQQPLPGVALGVVCLLPREPLREGETYTVAASADYDGKPWTKTWTFTTKKPADADVAALEATILTRMNEIRKEAGLKPVVMDADLSRTCRRQAQDVVVSNTRPAKETILGLGVSDPSTAVDDCLPTFYHRIPLLAPELRRIGFGCARHPNGSYVTVLDATSGK
ncbi:MAG TPA: CAP domain-containing protein [Gemmataceae bacterium]|nr:CAP domain-containing protein [Gemmataceae bacterium]